MTVESNLLMSRLVRARKSCPSYPAHWKKRMALTPTLSPSTDHHKFSASNLAWPSLEPALKPQLPQFLNGTISLSQKILRLRPAPSQLRGSCSPTLLRSIDFHTFSPSLSCVPSLLRDLPVLLGIVEGMLRPSACAQLFLPILGLAVLSSACLPQPLLLSWIPPSAATSPRSFLLLPMCSWLFCSPF